LMLQEQGMCDILGVDCHSTDLLSQWATMAHHLDTLTEEVHIAMVGKYTDLSDAYLSVIKSLQHAAMAVDRKLVIDWIEASHLEATWETTEREAAWSLLRNAHGVLVPGGFGDRGIEGKILAAHYARTESVPYLGICLGLQIATIEFCRNVLGLKGANSTEFEDNPEHAAVVFMPEISKTHLGGTMRLGSRPTLWQSEGSTIRALYGEGDSVDERHRHRYEVNPDLIERIEGSGLVFVGKDESGQRCEIFELEDHPYYVGVQFHPEFKSRPGRPSPPFLGLLQAASKR
jgi:CTP synthase